MARPSTEASAWAVIGPDPGLALRRWIALLLRMSIGLSLLNTGLAGYMGAGRVPGGFTNPMTQFGAAGGLEPFYTALPYLAIGLGLALILGFLTTASAIASGFYTLVIPLFMTVQIVSGGMAGNWTNPGRNFGDPIMMMLMSSSVTTLLPQVLLIWLSPLENHPYSIDTLIFGRDEVAEPPPAPDSTEPPETISVELEPPMIIGE